MADKGKRNLNDSKFSGLHRAMPIILCAFALFIGLCFFLEDMGILGRVISNVLLGLFSYGAYLIPPMIVFHAVFYRYDAEERHILSRIFFSLSVLLIFSSAICTFNHLDGDISFSAVESYMSGQERIGGGFIGNIISFALVKTIGVGGYFILTGAIFAIYVTYLIARDNVNVKKMFYSALSSIARSFAAVERKIKKSKEARAEKKAKKKLLRDEKRLQRDDERRRDLYRDEYFDVNNGIEELTIDELGIGERRSRAAEELNPNLSDRVYHKSAANKNDVNYDQSSDGEVYFTEDTVTVKMSEGSERSGRKPDLDYGIDVDSNERQTPSFTEQKQSPKSSFRSGSDDSAESVFTKDFDPFYFAASEKFASKPSSRAAEASGSTRTEDGGMFGKSIDRITEEDVARARRQADFEERKRRIIERENAIRQEEAARKQRSAPETGSFSTPVKEEPTNAAPKRVEASYSESATVSEEHVDSPAEEIDEDIDSGSYTATAPDDDEQLFTEPIPENEQSRVVLEQRRMFTIFDEPAPTADTPYSTSDSDMPDVAVSEYVEGEEDLEVSEVAFDGAESEINLVENDPSSYVNDPPPFDFDEEDPFARGKSKADDAPVAERRVKRSSNQPDYSNYKLPSLDLLAEEDSEGCEQTNVETAENANKLIETLASFNVTASIKGFDRGPRITRYEVVPARGVKVSSIMNLFDDIALNLAAEGIRMEAPIPGKSAVGVEIPNSKPYTVRLRSLLETEEFISTKSKTAVCVGKDVAGHPVFGDVSKMPHMLIAGATGMGKSVCINSLLISMLYKARPDEVKFIMIDPKKVEFNIYNGIPHLLIPVVTDPKQAAGALMWAVEQMEKRYDLIERARVRNIEAYNAKVLENPDMGEPLPKIVIVVDELADLMLQVKNPVEGLIMSIAQKARAAGIHLIIGTQRPSVDIITGVIKANIPTRISCKVMSNADSRTVLDIAGAEKLLDKGDMLFNPAGAPKPKRVQGAFVSDSEVESIIEFIKSQAQGNIYDDQALEEINRAAQKCSKEKNSGGRGGYDDDGDDGDVGGLYNNQEFLDAVDVAVSSGKISTSLLQRKLSIGFGKAAKFIDSMEDLGIVGGPNGQKPREVLITKDEWHEKLSRVSLD